MSFKRYYPTKDTFIANADGIFDISLNSMGASEILNLYRTAQYGSTASILLSFDAIPSGSQAVLKLFDAQHSETLPTEFNVFITPLEQSWTEGQGHDLDYYTDFGAANWVSASAGVLWAATTGASYLPFYFATGHEDLELDISSLTSSMWAGLKIEVSPAQPSGDYYIKKFHSRHTHFPVKKPFIELRQEDWVGTLTTSSIRYITSGTMSGTVWPHLMTGSIATTLVNVTNSIVDPTGVLVSVISDLKPVYNSYEDVTLHLTVRSKDYNPATVVAAPSVSPGTVLMDAYYRVVNEGTGEVVVPYGTGTTKFTKLSWNDTGNYFNINMASLPTGTLMRFDFLYNISGTTTSIPGDNFTFRIV